MAYQKIDNWQKREEIQGLLDLPNKPKELFSLGQWDPTLFSDCVAIVGSRRMTTYGKQVIEKIVPQLVLDGKTIISGFMYGVDQYAHRTCMEQGGKTIAVLGWGITQPLEGEDAKLAQKIIETGGLILSEWIDQKPTLWTFPSRNRIIVALSQEVIVIEAAVKSGSLITAKLATKLKRKLWAVPGPITSKTSEGTNALIAQGVALLWQEKISTLPLSEPSHPLLKLLTIEALTTNELSRKTNTPIAQIGAELSILALSGQVIERDGKYYVQ